MPNFKVTITGDKELQAKLRDPQFVRGPVRQFLARSAILMEGNVKKETPVDTGRLRASVTHQVEPFRAVVGTPVAYAPHVEWGTRPHWPPLAALQPWARRHGFPAGPAGAFLVARAIARRGTRARRMFQTGVKESRSTILAMWNEVGEQIAERWRR